MDHIILMSCTANEIIPDTPIAITCAAPTDGPMWTDIFSAWGTLGATVAALVFGAISLVLTFHERRLRRAQELDIASQQAKAHEQEVKSQAERVACWLQIDMAKYPSFEIIVENASDEPIWEVTVYDWVSEAGKSGFPVLPPGARRSVACPAPPGVAQERAIDVRFRDNSGRDWFRPGGEPGKLVLENDTPFDHVETSPSGARGARRER
jgi:hypothetical protein